MTVFNIIAILFILSLDLTIGLIHVIVQQIQKIRVCIVAWRKVLPTKKCLVTSLWSIFIISRQPRRIRKNRDHRKFLLMQRYLSKNSNSPSSTLNPTLLFQKNRVKLTTKKIWNKLVQPYRKLCWLLKFARPP